MGGVPIKKIKLTKKHIVSLLVTVVVLIASFLPTLNIKSIPTWNEIYTNVGLKDEVSTNKSPLSVHYIDVGQGDCTLIKSKDFIMLIDSGESYNSRKILNYLKMQKVDTIDYLVATHPHSDHIGGMSEIIKNVDIKNIFMPRLSLENTPTTNLYANFLDSVKNSSAKVKLVDKAENFSFEGISFEILSPCIQYNDLNNMSIIIKLTYKDTKFLFMGDAEKEVEQDLANKNIDLTCNVLKVGHHGSSTSTTEEFLERVTPQIAVISCGEDNRFGHPNKETIEILNKYKVIAKRTDINGNIVINSNGSKISVNVEKGGK